MRKTILYLIDSLERGGAEVLLVSALREVHQEFNIVLVTLHDKSAFGPEELCYDAMFCLNMQSKLRILSCVRQLKKIIHEYNVDIVQSALYWSVITARLACNKRTKHIFRLDNVMTSAQYNYKWYSGYTKLLETLTYTKNQVIIAPTEEVLTDFNRSVGIKGRSKVIYNFIKDEFFENQIEYVVPSTGLKLVAVGNLKHQKNYSLLIEAFKLLQHNDISIDIYGEGSDREMLQRQIVRFNLPIRLMGMEENIYKILPYYDGFVMCSTFEGFGISAAEAMAMGLPLLLSDIPVLREISHNNAIFFDPYSAQSFSDAVLQIMNGKINLKQLSDCGKKIAGENYTKEKYLNQLLNYYEEILNPSKNLIT
ncbi:MAG TPA: glycosyltransferase [Chitinophagaceae bacterium]|nr:glycosyltransferase [Chitinophagaceae bacterium]